MIEKDTVSNIKIQRAANGALNVVAMIEACFVDDSGAIVASRPNPEVLQVPIAADDPALLGILAFIATQRQAKIDAARAAEAARVAAELEAAAAAQDSPKPAEEAPAAAV